MKNNIVVRAICIVGFLVLIILIAVFATIYSHWDDNYTSALKDSLATTSGIFGGLATLAAAIVAAYLFNDWKEQHNKQISNALALQAYEEFTTFQRKVLEFTNYVSEFEGLLNSYTGFDLTLEILHKEGHHIYVQNIVNTKSQMSITFLSFLSKLNSYLLIKDSSCSFDDKYEMYHEKFVLINAYELEVYNLRDNLNEWETNLIGYRDLEKLIKNHEIKELLNDLKA